MGEKVVIKINGKSVVSSKPVGEPTVTTVKSRWSGSVEETRLDIIDTITKWAFPPIVMAKLTLATGSRALASGAESAQRIRSGFEQLLDVFTAIAEPILWFYALTACILMATKNKEAGWSRLKQVGYAYAGIALLPTFFAFLRWVAELVKGSITF